MDNVSSILEEVEGIISPIDENKSLGFKSSNCTSASSSVLGS